MGEVFEGVREGCYLYSRHTNPSNSYLGQCFSLNGVYERINIILFWHGSYYSLLYFSYVISGDEIISSRTIYGGTYAFMKNFLPKFNIKTKFVNTTNTEQVKNDYKKHKSYLL